MKRLLIAATLATLSHFSWATPQTDEVTANLKRLYPQTAFKSVKETPVTGVYEVVMGRNVAYVDQTARFFLFGRLIDMPVQKDLTESTLKEAQKVDVASLPLSDAIKSVRGKGERVLYVFSDPDCGYCKKLEDTLRVVQNATIYTFLFPLDSHPDANRKSTAIWCAQDRTKAWEDFMRKSTLPSTDAAPACETPIARNLALGRKLGATGTPTLINANGKVEAGALGLQDLEAFLSGQETKVAAK